jgi:hypothetical protein
VADATFRGVVQFSDANLITSALSAVEFPLFRVVITDEAIRVEGRWKVLRSVLESRSYDLGVVTSARLRGTFIILYLRDDDWCTVSSGLRCTQIMRELEARGVPTTRDP